MTYITQLTGRKEMSSSRIMTMVLAGFVLVVLQSSTVRAQWATNGNNINNTNTGNVGIGTTSPGVRLDVDASASSVGAIRTKTALGQNVFQYLKPDGTNLLRAMWDGGNFHHYLDGSLYFNLNGNSVVFADGTLRSTTLRVDLTNPANWQAEGLRAGDFTYANATTSLTTQHFAMRTFAWNGSNGYSLSSNAGLRLEQLSATNENARLSLVVGTTQRLSVLSDGNVGIGTTTPGAKLDVSGSTFLQYVTLSDATSYGAISFRETGGSSKGHIAMTGSGSGSTYVGGANAFQIWNGQNTPMVFGTNGSERVRIDASGSVGIGTTTPLTKLHVAGGTRVDGTSGRVYLGTGAVPNYRGLEIIEENATTFSIRHHDPNVAWQNIAINPYGGNVGIGTLAPSTKFHVVGDGTITGNLTVSGTINAKYQDVAEWVQSSQELRAGTVVVLDQTKSNQVIASSQAYDTRVAGVISSQPGITLGENGESKVLVATTGRVKVKVDATSGQIKVGDLLVTSDKEGFAMKSEPITIGKRKMHAPGTLIGKALEPLEKGTGEILVLLSLQ